MMADPKQKLGFAGLPAVDVNSFSGFLSASMSVAQEDAVKAELAPPESLNAMTFAQREAYARGSIRGFVNSLDKSNPDTVQVLTALNGAIRSQDFNAINTISPKLGSILSIYQGNPKAFDDYNSYSKEYLQGQISYVTATTQLAEAEAKAATAEAVRIFNFDTANAATSVFNTASSIQGIGSFTRDMSGEIEGLRKSSVYEADDVKREALTKRADDMESALIGGIVTNISRGKTPEDIVRIRSAFADGNVSILNDSERASFLIMDSFQSPDARKKVDDQLRSYADGPAKFTEDKLQADARNEVSAGIASQLPGMTSLRSLNAITEKVSSLNTSLAGIQNLPDGDRATAQEQISVNAARASLNVAMSATKTESDTLAIATYVRTGDRGNLSDATVSALNSYKAYGSSVGDKGFIDSTLNASVLQRTRQIEDTNKAIEADLSVYRVSTGQGDPKTEAGRKAASSFALNEYNLAITKAGASPLQSLPRDLFTNPTYLNDMNLSPVFQAVYSTPNAMPEELLVALSSVADGNVRSAGGYDYKTILQHWNKMKLVRGTSGAVANPAINSLTEEQRGMLDFLSDAPRLLGSEDAVVGMMASAQLVRQKEGFPANVKQFLGGKDVAEWMQESLGNDYALLTPSQRESVEALTTTMIAQSLSTEGIPMTPKSLASRLNAQMNEWFPDGDGYVVQYDSNGVPSRRTKYALSQTTGRNQDDFVSYVLDNVAQYAGPELKAKNFYRGSQGGVLGSLATTSSAIMYGLGAEQPPYLELVAYGPDGLGGVSYYVHEVNPDTGLRTTVMRNDNNGPLIVSTMEKGFASIVSAKAAKEKADALAYKNQYDMIVNTPGP